MILTVSPPFTQPTSGTLTTMNYRIIRAPRVSSDEQLEFPAGIAIDLTPNDQAPKNKKPGVPGYIDGAYNLTPAPATPSYDILFGPSGAVVGPAAATDKIIFWVRDMTAPNPWDNDPVLVCIYTRSGAIAAQALDVTGGNPGTSYYTFTINGRPSGQ
jgi:hypothetical protein